MPEYLLNAAVRIVMNVVLPDSQHRPPLTFQVGCFPLVLGLLLSGSVPIVPIHLHCEVSCG